MVEFGVGFGPDQPVEQLVAHAKLSEDLGYRHFALFDARFDHPARDPFLALAACALNTKKITLGPLVSDPFTRLPALLAMTMATLDDVSKGRAILGYGAGGSAFVHMGVKISKPVAALRDGIYIINNLIAGKTVTRESVVQRNSVLDANLGYKTRHVPIYLASRSPKVLQLAGEIADGVIIGSYSAEKGIRYALGNIREGAKRVGRDMKNIELVSWIYTCVSKDRERAIENVKPMAVTAAASTSADAYPEVGVSTEEMEPIRAIISKRGFSVDAMKDAAKLASEELVDKFSVAGTAEDCIDKIKRIKSCGINKIWIWPFPSADKTNFTGLDKLLKLFSEDVISQFP